MTHALAILLLLSGLLGQWWWPLDLFCHFWPYVGGCLILLAIWHGVRRHTRRLLVALATVAFWTWPLWAYYLPQSRPPKANIRVLVANLYSGNETPEAAIGFIQSQQADVLVLLEVSPIWKPHLQALAKEYPFQKILSRNDNFGIAVCSRIPVDDIVQKRLGSLDVPSIIADFPEPGLRLIATHPMPPLGSRNTGYRNQQLAEVAELAAACETPCMVAGDLNLTPWSPNFRQLLRDGRLQDSAWGCGVQSSWPTWTPWPLLPIDHVLTSSTIQTLNRTVGPDIGSDHRPVIVDLSIESTASE